jgi:hypothetical protein
LSYLVGLPRYVWTRNKIMLNQTKRIASHVGEAGIEIVAIKGMGDLISDAEDGMMRSTVDLDLLIRPEDFSVFKINMSELGYELQEHNGSASLIPHDQLQFVPTNGTQSYVDLHLMANKYQEDDRLTATIWKEKMPSNVCPTLFVPSRQGRFWLSVANAFRLHNWQTESHLKYLNDALAYLSTSDGENIEETVEKGKKIHLLQDWQEQIIQLGFGLDILKNKTHLSLDKTNNNYSKSKIKLIIQKKINNKINSITNYKIRYAIELSDKYTQNWRARNAKGNYWKVILFLSTKVLYKVTTFVWRRIRSRFRTGKPLAALQTEVYHKKLRDIKWYI